MSTTSNIKEGYFGFYIEYITIKDTNNIEYHVPFRTMVDSPSTNLNIQNSLIYDNSITQENLLYYGKGLRKDDYTGIESDYNFGTSANPNKFDYFYAEQYSTDYSNYKCSVLDFLGNAKVNTISNYYNQIEGTVYLSVFFNIPSSSRSAWAELLKNKGINSINSIEFTIDGRYYEDMPSSLNLNPSTIHYYNNITSGTKTIILDQNNIDIQAINTLLSNS